MRIQLLIAASLATSSCSETSNSCPPGPEGEPFELALDLDVATVQDLLDASNQSDPAKLVCADVCTSPSTATAAPTSSSPRSTPAS